MKKCLGVLAQPTPSAASEAELASDQQEREGALELLADLCENMDNAAGAQWGDFCPHPALHRPFSGGPCSSGSLSRPGDTI